MSQAVSVPPESSVASVPFTPYAASQAPISVAIQFADSHTDNHKAVESAWLTGETELTISLPPSSDQGDSIATEETGQSQRPVVVKNEDEAWADSERGKANGQLVPKEVMECLGVFPNDAAIWVTECLGTTGTGRSRPYVTWTAIETQGKSPEALRKSIEAHVREATNFEVDFASLKLMVATGDNIVAVRQRLDLPDSTPVGVDPRLRPLLRPSTGQVLLGAAAIAPAVIAAFVINRVLEQ